jgi:hypothetical protein
MMMPAAAAAGYEADFGMSNSSLPQAEAQTKVGATRKRIAFVRFASLRAGLRQRGRERQTSGTARLESMQRS